ncbi:MAG: VCBS repeat-containing protein [Melioribacteraceae bacterium]|nr:VCBS repeat-containing protein [Melioribacteraceae bacterium]
MKNLKGLIVILLTAVLQISAIDTIPGNALEFDGTDDYISGSGIDTLMTAVTIEAWICHNDLDPGEIQRYVTLDPETAVLRYDGANGTNQLHFYIKKTDGSYWDIRVNNILTTGGWFHVAGTYDGTTMKLYMNGNLLKTSVPAGGGFYAPSGNYLFSYSAEAMSGKIDEVRIWNVARTTDEIRKSMHLSLIGTEPGLLNNWQFNEGSGTLLTDTVGGATGTLYNMDNSDWTDSTVPYGSGSSDLKIIDTPGSYDFTGTGVSMNVTYKTGTDTLLVSRLDLPPNILPTNTDVIYDSQYWIINSYGGGNTTADISCVTVESYESIYETKPVFVKLHGRSANSDTVWIHTKDATSVNTTANITEFSEISEFGQFIISKDYLPSFTILKNPPFELITASFNGINLLSGLSRPAFTDLDGDGLLDLLIGQYIGNLCHYEQTSPNSTSFAIVTESFNGIDVGNAAAPAFSDIDGDGLLDLLIGEQNGNINHYEQSAPDSTSFTLITESFNSINASDFSDPEFTDLDGDGKLDLLIGETGGKILHYEQLTQNSTTFWNVTYSFNGIDVGSRSSPAVADLDRDGLLDLLIGEYDGNINHYEQNAPNSTSFTLITESFNGIDVGSISSPVITDLEDNGMLDLIIGETNDNINHYEQVEASDLSFGVIIPERNSVKDYYINADNLISDLNITVSSEFTISLSEDTGYTTNLSVTPVDGRISCPVYVKFSPADEAEYNSTIIHTADSCQTKYIALSGTGEYLSKVPGTALEFDGVNDYMTCNDDNSLDLTDNYTIEAWIKPAGFSAMGGIVSKYQTAGANGYFLRLNNVSPYTGLSFDALETENGVLEAEKWYHIAAVNDNGTRHLYVNGMEKTITGTPQVVNSNTNPLRIGVDFLSSPRYFNGRIDEVRLWNIVRNLQDIRQNMNSPLKGNEAGLVSCWQMNEGSGTVEKDMVNGNDATLSNMDNSDWVDSTIPFGEGNVNTQIVSTTGLVDFTDTGIVIDFKEKAGTDTIVVKQINFEPNIDPADPDSVFNSQYWVIHKFGTGIFTSDISVKVSEDLTSDDGSNPTSIKLYTRTVTSDSSWVYHVSSAEVDHATDIASFHDVSEFGQIIICKGEMDIPANVTTETIDSNLKISWDAVPGAASYKVFASDDPYGTFEDVSVSGIFDGASWTITYSESRKFFYVVAVTGTKKFENNVGNRKQKTY